MLFLLFQRNPEDGGRQGYELVNSERPKIDYVGLITLIIGIGALQIVLDQGNDADWFNSGFIIVASIIAAVALAIFLIWELTDQDPIVDLRLFRHRTFAAGTLAMVLGYAAFFSIALLVPLWLQQDLGYTAIWAGYATAPLGVIPILLTFFAGKYAGRTDLRLLAEAAFLVMGATCLMRAGFYLQVDFYHVAMAQLLQGLGVALFFMPVLSILLSDLQQNEIAAGSGLSTFLRTLGGSFSASITIFLWNRRSVVHHEHLAEHITTYNPLTQACRDGQRALSEMIALAARSSAMTCVTARTRSRPSPWFRRGWGGAAPRWRYAGSAR